MRKLFNEMSILFPLLTIYTLVYLGLMIYDFAAKDAFTMPDGMMIAYIALVGAYSADKEIRRWLGKSPQSRKGSMFVYAWMLFLLAAFIIHSLKREYAMPADLTKVALQVLGIFFGSKASKKICETKGKTKAKAKGSDETPGREERILSLIAERGRVTNRDVADRLGVSSATSERLLDGLETAGKIKQEGVGRGTYYTIAK